MMPVSVVDLFCGVGGMTHGFALEDFDVVAGVDIDETCRYPYEVNNYGAKFHKMDLLEAPSQTIEDLFPVDNIKVLIGCAPCQPYSSNSQAKRRNDDKWRLVPRFAEIVEEVQPEIVSMENVPALANFSEGNIFKDFVKTLEEAGYHVWSDTVYCPDYGVPQIRKRLVLLASKFGDFRIINGTYPPDQYLTVRDTIEGLPPIAAGETDDLDFLHRARKLANINLQRIKQSHPGGTWQDWDEDLLAECHRKSSGSTYKSVYGRMTWDDPAPTITTQAYCFGSGRFGHPDQHRALSLREMALLQTFPLDYEFVKPGDVVYLKRIGTLIGNAVPVNLGRAIAKSIKRHLIEHEYDITER